MPIYRPFDVNVKPSVADSPTSHPQVTEVDLSQVLAVLAPFMEVAPEALLAAVVHVSQFTEDEIDRQVRAAQRIVASEVLSPSERLNLIREALRIDCLRAPSSEMGCDHGR